MKLIISRLFFLRIALIFIVIVSLELLGYAGLWLNSRSLDWLSNKSYFHIRAMLAGCNDANMRPKFLTLPYLGYIPFPGYSKNGIIQHNEDGYRGKKIALMKGNKFRVLCIGGSTTYGFGVDSPAQAFPARLEVLLENYIQKDTTLSKQYSGAEVINAGLDASTSADELIQYLLKYRYYRADAVVVHSGINDALILSSAKDFQLDYTHYRRINFHLEPLSQPMRFFMKSYFISYFAIQLFYNNFSLEGDEYGHQGRQTFCKWTDLNMDSILKNKQFFYYPFYKNTRSLFQEIASDGSQLFVLPNVLNIKSNKMKTSGKYYELSNLNIALSDSLCREFGGLIIPFSYQSIKSASSWVDDCHLDAPGEYEKAVIVFESLTPFLRKN